MNILLADFEILLIREILKVADIFFAVRDEVFFERKCIFLIVSLFYCIDRI